MASFWFWFALGLCMLALNVVWWVVAIRLTKRRLWRVLISIFMAAQTAAHFSAMAGVDFCHTPKPVTVPPIK